MVGGGQEVFQHFRPEERVFVEKTMDKIEQVLLTYSYQLTSFLNPRQAFIVESLARRAGLEVFSSDQIWPTESRRLIIAPAYYELVADDFEIVLLELIYARKFNHLTHGQILGNLVNQLGIKRDLLGDILLTQERSQVLVDAKLSQYLMDEVKKISRLPVEWQPKSRADMIVSEDDEQVVLTLATSWRLDHLLALAYSLSRKMALKLVESGKVKVNHQPIDQPAQQLAVNDLVSCRGYGRFRISDCQGQTKQGKLKLSLSKVGGK